MARYYCDVWQNYNKNTTTNTRLTRPKIYDDNDDDDNDDDNDVDDVVINLKRKLENVQLIN